MASILTSVLSCSITSSGISAPTYDEIYQSLVTMYQTIYGSDIILDNSTQDGQLVGIFAEALDQVNSACIQVYNSFSPTFAQGAGLSSVVKINGIARKTSSYSTVDLLLTGTAGTTLSNCLAQDVNGYSWAIPAGTVISEDGTVVATATCTTIGSITAAVDTVTTIGTPVLGWSGVTNTTAAASGAPVETDATLRLRQVSSTMLPSQTVLDGLTGQLLSLSGVTLCKVYENPTNTPDVNGIGPYTIAVVIEGGDAMDIAKCIAVNRTLGVSTQGSVSEQVTDNSGNTHTINFYRPSVHPITITISILILTGYTDAIGTQIRSAVVDYVNNLGPGDTLYIGRLYKYANLDAASGGNTYDVTGFGVWVDGNPVAGNPTLPYNGIASCTLDSVTVELE